MRALLGTIPNCGLTRDYFKKRALLGTISNAGLMRDYLKSRPY